MTMKPIRDSLGRLMDEKQEAGEGKFHGWGVEYEEFENGPGNYSVAIVEMPDGTVQTLMPSLVRFLISRAPGIPAHAGHLHQTAGLKG